MARLREDVDAPAMSITLDGIKDSKLSATKMVEDQFTGFIKPFPKLRIGRMESPAHEEADVEETGFYITSKPSPVADPTPDRDKHNDETMALHTGFYVDSTPSSALTIPSQDHYVPSMEEDISEPANFFIDTTPAAPPAQRSNESIAIDRVASDVLLGEDDEIIVYVAPHPRLTKMATPIEPAPILPSTSILTGTTSTFSSTATTTSSQTPTNNENSVPSISQAPAFDSVSFSFTNGDTTSTRPRKQQPRTRPVFTAGERAKSKAKAQKKEARAIRRRLERRAMFGSFGAMMSEAQLRGSEERSGKDRDPRWDERRRGDSDIDWGDADQEDGGGGADKMVDGVDEVSNGMGAMELDSDISVEAMKAFVKGMSANGGRHVTMDDIADEERMRLEDQNGKNDSDSEVEEEGSDEEDDMMDKEEAKRIGSPEDGESEDEEDDFSNEIDYSPNAGFQARLQRLRKHSQGNKTVDEYLLSEEDASEDGLTWAEEVDGFIAHAEVYNFFSYVFSLQKCSYFLPGFA